MSARPQLRDAGGRERVERPERARRRLTIVGQRVLHTFDRGDGGQPGRLYEVRAVTADGEPVREKLRSFLELPAGIPLEVEVERYEHPRHGVSYTLHLPRASARDLSPRVLTLEAGFVALQRRVEHLETRIAGPPARRAPAA